jgi:ABC-type uncharacterized transport system permease subunit
MALIDIHRNPSRRELLWFGLLLLLFFGLVGGLVLWRSESLTASISIWTVGGLLTVVYYAVRPLRLPIFLGWIYVAYPIGFVMSHLVLGVIYFLVITPIGLIMRLLGRDPMERQFDRAAKSYWTRRGAAARTERYFRQF